MSGKCGADCPVFLEGECENEEDVLGDMAEFLYEISDDNQLKLFPLERGELYGSWILPRDR